MKFQNVLILIFACIFFSMAFTPDQGNNDWAKYNDGCVQFSDLEEAAADQLTEDFNIYRDRIKEEKYDKAYSLWKKVYEKAPKTNGKIDYVFRDGIKIYQSFYKSTSDSVLQQKYVDTLKMIYEKAVICFPEKKSFYFSKEGVDMFYKYRGNMDNKDIYNRLKIAVELDGEQSRVSTIIPLASLNFSLYVDDKVSREDARITLDNINKIVKMNLKNCENDKECNAWTQVDQYILDLNNRFENQKGFYDCDFFMEKYYAAFEAAPSDCELIEELYRRFKSANCGAENSNMVKLIDAYKSNCMKPTTDSDLAGGRESMENEQYQNAIACYERYINKTENQEAKANINLRIAKIYYIYIRNFPKAREYAKRAVQNNPNFGEPYILIGKLYASSSSICGPGTGFDSQVVTWVAIDKWNEAKRKDPSVAAEANQLINQYSKFMPSMEDVFSRPKVNQGESFKVGCWINENTIVRVAK